jgi:hypothetical protein
MDKQTIFDQINDIKQVANDYVGRLIDFYGSPENDQPVLRIKKEFPTYTFNGVATVSKVVKTDDGSILYVCNGAGLTYLEIPIEGMLKIAYEISCQQGIGDMFNELFKGEDVE